MRILSGILLIMMTLSASSQTDSNIADKKNMRELLQLIDTKEPGMNIVRQWYKGATNEVEILPCDLKRAEQALYETQVTTRSPMGAIIYETGGILINGGWIRILGSGHPRFDRSLPGWNKGKYGYETGKQSSVLLVADDILGGFFAINGGGLSPENIGKVFYFAPDTQVWEPTELGYSDFIVWCFQGDLNLFYQGFYWKGYENELKTISGTDAVSFYPFLWTEEGTDINNCTRKIVPVQEIWDMSVGK